LGTTLAPKAASAGDPAVSVGAASSDDSQKTQQAADLYDDAKRLYDAGDYARAADTFLQADAVVPSSDALSSAIAAGRQAQNYGLIARACQRAIAREQSDPLLAARARIALHEAEPHLAHLAAQCTPQPCSLLLDQQPLLEQDIYLSPGSYLLSAEFPDGTEKSSTSSASKQLQLEAGKQYSEILMPNAISPASAAPVQTHAARPTPNLPGAAPPGDNVHRPIPQWVFYTGAGVTAVLAGVTVWSGIDTLNAKKDLPSQYAPNYAAAAADVDSNATRTDWLLGATLITAATTAAIGIWWVDWEHRPIEVGVAATSTGMFLNLRGQLQ
jgi:hypothetical protein